MTQRTGAIPQPIEGYKLVIKDVEYFISPNKNVWVNKDFDRVRFGNDTLLSGLTYQLLPILNSGVWISGKMPLPEAKEGTLLLLEYLDENQLASMPSLPVIIVAYVLNNQWQTLHIDEYNNKCYSTIYQSPNKWQWISAPKLS